MAVKVIRPDHARRPEYRARFLREMEAARRVGGGHTAAVLGSSGRLDESPWLATEFLAAPALATLVAECGPWPTPAVRWLAAGIAEGLAAVHEADLVHRDLKPSNVLITLDGPKVIDFGIVRDLEAGATSLTHEGTLPGTPGFTAPELLNGEAPSARADVFSLGAVLYLVATGKSPFGEGDPVQVSLRVLKDAPELSLVPAPVRDLVAGCLHAHPAQRLTLDQVLDDFAAHADTVDNPHTAGSWLPARVVERIRVERDGPRPQRLTPEAVRDRLAEARADNWSSAAEARDRFAELAQQAHDILGAEDPLTLNTRQWHGYWTGQAGDVYRACDLLAEVVADHMRILGPDDQRTLGIRHDYGYWLGARDPARARDLFADLSKDALRLLGPEDEATLAARHWHAYGTGKAGDPARGRDLFVEVIADRLRVFGPDDERTLASRHAHANWVGEAGDPAQARDLLEGVVAGYARVLGVDHPRTNECRRSYARWTRRAQRHGR